MSPVSYNDESPDDVSPDDVSPDDESPDDESPNDESPDDESPRVTPWRLSVTQITRIHPPAPGFYDQHSIKGAPAHDPVRARQVVSELGTVAGVVEELEPMRRRDIGHPWGPEDLDFVTVGCWGNAVQIADPALGDHGISFNLDNEFDAQVKSHPDARIIGVCEMGFSMTYAKYLVHVPGVPRVGADGWEEMELAGDPVQTLSAIGATVGDPATADLSLEDLEGFVWSDYLDLLSCGLHVPYAGEQLRVSVFKVARSEGVRDEMEEVWLRD